MNEIKINAVGSNRTVLVADDDPGILRLIVSRLTKSGYNVIQAINGNQAIEAAKQQPRLMLLDFILPDMKSDELVQTLRDEGIQIPFVIMTGYGDERTAVTMMKLGALDYILKEPTFFDFLPANVDRIFDKLDTDDKLIESEAALQASTQRYSKLFSNATDGVFFTDKDDLLIDYNNSFAQMFDFKENHSEIIKFGELIAEQDRFNDYSQLIKDKTKIENLELKMRTVDDGDLYCLVRAVPEFDENGVLVGYQGIIRDNTEQTLYRLKILSLNKDLEQRVAERTAKLKNTLDELEHENDERKKTQVELLQTQDDLSKSLVKEKQLNDLKSRFISTVTHEFRTPLTVILTSSYVLDSTYQKQDSEQFNKYLNRIQNSVELMNVLLEDAIFLQKNEAGKFNYNFTRIDSAAISAELASELRLIESAHHDYVFDSSLETAFIDSNEFVFRQIFSNLLSNASKYSPKGSKIIFRVAEESEYFVYSVSNPGIGIPEDELGDIFTPFHRAKNVGTISGTGLGMAIVKNAVENHNGQITVTSEVDEGCHVEVKLPKID